MRGSSPRMRCLRGSRTGIHWRRDSLTEKSRVFALLLAAAVLAGCESRQAPRGRVVLIGLDGASWNLLAPMVESGELPNFKALMDRGVSADLASVEPYLSPPVWTSIATGRKPAAHGVDFFYANRYSIKVPTMWD